MPYGAGRETRVVYNITSGERPRRPNNAVADRWLPDPIWDALQHCWGPNPDSRWPIKSLGQAFAKQTGNTQVTESNEGVHNEGEHNILRFARKLIPTPFSFTAKIHVKNLVVLSSGSAKLGQHESPLPEGGEQTPDTTEPPIEVPKSPTQSQPQLPKQKRNPFRAFMAGIRRLVKRPKSPDQPQTSTQPQTPKWSRKSKWSRSSTQLQTST